MKLSPARRRAVRSIVLAGLGILTALDAPAGHSRGFRWVRPRGRALARGAVPQRPTSCTWALQASSVPLGRLGAQLGAPRSGLPAQRDEPR